MPMSASRPFLSIVIPAYNEERRIGQTLLAVEKYLSESQYSAEVIVADGGSNDNTVRVVEGYAKHIDGLSVISVRGGFGKGFVVRNGMLAATGELRLFTDADNATPIEELEKLLPFARSPGRGDDDVVIASIALSESKIERPESGIRPLAGKLANLLIQMTVLPGIWDTQRGFKLFTAEAAERIFSLGRIDRWGFDIEVLALARRLGFSTREVPVRWIHDPDSKVTGSAYLNTLWDLARVRWWLWANSYDVRTVSTTPRLENLDAPRMEPVPMGAAASEPRPTPRSSWSTPVGPSAASASASEEPHTPGLRTEERLPRARRLRTRVQRSRRRHTF